MKEISNFEMQSRARELFERDNPGRLWREPAKAPSQINKPFKLAGLIERQTYLARAADQLRSEGFVLSTEKNPPQLSPGG